MFVKPDKQCILFKQDYVCEDPIKSNSIHILKSLPSSESVNCDNIVAKESIENFEGINSTLWSSIYIAAGLSFVGSAQFSLYFSSLWPYLQIVRLII